MSTDDAQNVVLDVNGCAHEVAAPVGETLATTLRTRLGLRSAREACGIGICGTCTVQVDDQATSACLMLTHQAAGHRVRTSEGLVDPDGTVSRVQQAFLDNRAYQCSYCIPGMVVSVDACLRANPTATVAEVREFLSGNLCRCGTYVSILEAVHQLVSQTLAEQASGSVDAG
jgi:aerobic-type carbon monoxide dehydrogenase small subunit (CoxS/CutS family)